MTQSINPVPEHVQAIRNEETWHERVGTSRVYFDEASKRYSIQSCGARYLVAVNVRPGRIGSIIVPDTYRPSETSGFIVGLGDGLYSHPLGEYVPPPLQIGDMVLFGLYTGSKVELGGREFRIIQYDSVLGVLIPEGDTPDEEK